MIIGILKNLLEFYWNNKYPDYNYLLYSSQSVLKCYINTCAILKRGGLKTRSYGGRRSC